MLQFATAAVNAARDSHYAFNPVTGLFERTLLLEGARTNSAIGSNLFADSTYWNASADWTIAAAVSCIAGQTAWLSTNNGGATARQRNQTVGVFVSGQTDCSAFIVERPLLNPADTTDLAILDVQAAALVHQVTITWASLTIIDAAGSGGSGIIPLGPGPNGGALYMVYITGTGTASGTGAAGNTRRAFIYPSGTTLNTKALILHHAQFEANAAFPSSPIVTTTVPVTRSTDSLSFPFADAPEALTVYSRHIERGTVLANLSLRLWQLGGLAGERLLLFGSTGNKYYLMHGTAATTITTNAALPTPNFGDLVELRALMFADGSVQLGQSLNGGAEVVTPQTAALAFAGAWGSPTFSLGSASGVTSAGFAAFQALKIQRGIMTMDQMRAF